MSYYKLLGLEKEPFSTSPDPGFFYQSKEHTSALYRLRIFIELKRGLSLILGDVGTGKTTLSRRLAQLVASEPNTLMTMILNPLYESQIQFLADLTERLNIKHDLPKDKEPTVLDYMKMTEKFLLKKALRKTRQLLSS